MAERASDQLPKPEPGQPSSPIERASSGASTGSARREVWSDVRRPRRGHRRRQHRHRRAVRPPGAGRPVPRQPRRRRLRPQLQLVRPVRASAATRRAPCDNNGHGTHTMGTMVGDDGGRTNQIGVAPGAKWIAAKGCETSTCSDAALLASGQWIARADRPRRRRTRAPTCAPHIVNNSWGGGGGDPFYQDIVARLGRGRASSRRSPTATPGPAAAPSGSPGDYPEQLRRRRVRHQQRHRQLLQPRPSAVDGEHQAEHRRSGRQRALAASRRRVRQLQRHLDGLAARRRRGGADVVGGSGAASATSTRPERCSTTPRSTSTTPTLRRHRRRQQRLGRGPARRVRRGRAVAARPDRHPAAAPSPTPAPASRIAGATVQRRRARSTAPPPPAPTARTSSTLPVGDYDGDRQQVRLRHRHRRPADGHRGPDHHPGLRARPGARRTRSPGTVTDAPAAPVAGRDRHDRSARRSRRRPPTPTGVYSFAAVPEGEYDVRAVAGALPRRADPAPGRRRRRDAGLRAAASGRTASATSAASDARATSRPTPCCR